MVRDDFLNIGRRIDGRNLTALRLVWCTSIEHQEVLDRLILRNSCVSTKPEIVYALRGLTSSNFSPSALGAELGPGSENRCLILSSLPTTQRLLPLAIESSMCPLGHEESTRRLVVDVPIFV